MADVLDDNKGLALFENGKLFWFFTHVVVFFVLIFWVEPDWLREQTMLEAQGLGVYVGEEAAIDVFDRSVGWYESLVTEHNFEERLRNALIPNGGIDSTDQVVFDATGFVWGNAEEWLQNFWVLVFQALYRLNALLYWFVFSFPLVLAFALDGLATRAIRRQEFGWSSVNVFRFGAYMVAFAPVIITLYLMLPVMPVLAHLFPILFVICVALGARMMAANFMRYF